jgi:uncharacterized protein (TIGR02145 family)
MKTSIKTSRFTSLPRILGILLILQILVMTISCSSDSNDDGGGGNSSGVVTGGSSSSNGSGGGIPAKLSSNATAEQALSALNAVIAYSGTPATQKTEAQDLKENWFILGSAWSTYSTQTINQINTMIDAITSGSSSSVAIGGSSSSNGGEIYESVTIGTQTWMNKNLNRDAEGSVCYSNVPANCETYGRLYDWETATTICPTGWRLPSNDEWTELTDYIESDKGCSNCAGTHLKSASGWLMNMNGTDTYGFAALPGGYGEPNGDFGGSGGNGNWWTITEDDASHAQNRNMNFASASVVKQGNTKTNLYSVRCIKD